MISSQRLLLRPPNKADFPATAEMFAEEAVMRHIGSHPLSRADAWARLLRDVGHWAAEGFGLFSVIEKSTGDYVAKVGYALFERDLGVRAATQVEMSWTLRSRFHGRGYASEAARAAQQWFEGHRRCRTACLIAADNLPSIRLAARIGYTEADRLVRDRGEAIVLLRDP